MRLSFNYKLDSEDPDQVRLKRFIANFSDPSVRKEFILRALVAAMDVTAPVANVPSPQAPKGIDPSFFQDVSMSIEKVEAVNPNGQRKPLADMLNELRNKAFEES